MVNSPCSVRTFFLNSGPVIGAFLLLRSFAVALLLLPPKINERHFFKRRRLLQAGSI